jgi:AP2 domain
VCDYWGVRCRSRDGEWTVDVIRLSCTGNHRDGERLRVSRFGFFEAELAAVEDLASLVDLAELEEV